jgi:hypothetical protein
MPLAGVEITRISFKNGEVVEKTLVVLVEIVLVDLLMKHLWVEAPLS